MFIFPSLDYNNNDPGYLNSCLAKPPLARLRWELRARPRNAFPGFSLATPHKLLLGALQPGKPTSLKQHFAGSCAGICGSKQRCRSRFSTRVRWHGAFHTRSVLSGGGSAPQGANQHSGLCIWKAAQWEKPGGHRERGFSSKVAGTRLLLCRCPHPCSMESQNPGMVW